MSDTPKSVSPPRDKEPLTVFDLYPRQTTLEDITFATMDDFLHAERMELLVLAGLAIGTLACVALLYWVIRRIRRGQMFTGLAPRIDRAYHFCLYGSVACFFTASWFGRHGNIVAVAAVLLLAAAFALAGMNWFFSRRKPPGG